MNLSHVPTRIPRETFDGIECVRVNRTYAKGVDIATVIDGSAVSEYETWSSDGGMVNTVAWCEGCGAEHDNAVYWVLTGKRHGHGWACGKCRKVTQTG